MKIATDKQYTPEWWQARKGLPTASEFHRIITPKKWEFATGAETYACELIAQEYDLTYGMADDRATTAMKNGTIMEPECRRFYEFETSRDVREVGLCVSDCGRLACSPDGLVDEDGILELKHPTPAVMVKWLLAGCVPPEHVAQCHGALLVTKRRWIDFLAYYPGMDPLLVRVTPDEKTVALAEALEKFLTMLGEMRAKIHASGDRLAATRTPQESYFVLNRQRALALRDRVMADAKDRSDWRKGVELIATALGEQHLCCASLAEKALRFRAFAELIRDGYDHDSDAHKYGTPCRECEAIKLIGEKKWDH